MAIGGNTVANRVFLAPMSGVTDPPFRLFAAEAGAGLVISEMVASQEYVKGSAESLKRSLPAGNSLHMVQLAGREAYWMGEAARALQDTGADIIDINMGCPAKKVTGGYSGSALMRDLDHAMTLVDAVLAAATVPVTLKMRLGWDDQNRNAPELAERAEKAGISMITVHGRTRCQFYGGNADWAAVRAVRERITVPLVVNGDIRDRKTAVEALDKSGADAVMIGRASYGQPWLVGEVAGNPGAAPRSLADHVCSHYEMMLAHYGAVQGMRHSRKHLGWYLDRHAPDTDAGMRSQILTCETPSLVMNLMRQALDAGLATAERKVA